jgi:hypothetical protein
MVSSPTLANGTSGLGFCKASGTSLAGRWMITVAFDNCGKKLESVNDAFTGRGRDVNVLTSVVMHCGNQRLSMLPVGSPSASLYWFFVYDYFASWRSKSCFVVIHKTMKVLRGRELWMQSRGSKKIQRDFRLWQECVPQVQWEGGVNRGEPGHKVFLESTDGAFRGVASMAVRWHQLVSDIIDGEEALQSGR